MLLHLAVVADEACALEIPPEERGGGFELDRTARSFEKLLYEFRDLPYRVARMVAEIVGLPRDAALRKKSQRLRDVRHVDEIPMRLHIAEHDLVVSLFELGNDLGDHLGHRVKG